jgi:uncharacterized protein (TIGR00375 family)
MRINADLHIHSRFSGGVSREMTVSVLAREARKKGIDVIGCGDCLHSKWFSEIKQLRKVDEGTFELNSVYFILTAELEDPMRVHHLILFPTVSAVEDFKELIASKSQNLETDGRPKVHMPGWEIAQAAMDVDAIFGPCHAFTPWTGMYAAHNSLKTCYGDLTDKVAFIELGLSADSNYADRIAELEKLTFLTNSDAHSPYPVRLAREFNRFEVNSIKFDEIKKAILREGGRKSVLNVGIPPQEGKYNESACIRCYKHYDLKTAIQKGWICDCKGRIKKGVRDRVEEIATYKLPIHPEHRPKYLHLIPLAEIIAKALNLESPHCKEVFNEWNRLVATFSNEVVVLVDEDLDRIKRATTPEIANAIKSFRNGEIIIKPGGGGQYGKIILPEKKLSGQTKISDYTFGGVH